VEQQSLVAVLAARFIARLAISQFVVDATAVDVILAQLRHCVGRDILLPA